MTHFQDLGIQEQFLEGKSKMLVFPEGMQKLIKNAFDEHNYQEEALLFSTVAKICRREIFELDSVFPGTFADNCQDIPIPNIRRLVSMILYGPELHREVNESQPCQFLSQLLVHNAKQQKRKASANSNMHTSKREPPLPLYVGLSIHSITRSKGMVEKLEKLGLSVSYNRVIQVDKMLAHNVCEQFKFRRSCLSFCSKT